MKRIDKKSRQNVILRAFHIVSDFTDKKVSNFAASTAFFFFISLIPFCILLSTLLPLTGMDEASFTALVTGYTPEIVDGIVTSIIADAFASSGKVFSISLFAILYASGKGMIALMQGINVVYGIHEHRSYPRIAFVASIYMILLMVFIVFSLIIGVFGEYVYVFVDAHLPYLENAMREILAIRATLIFAVAVTLFLLMYTYTPAKNQKFFRQLPGAVFATVGWMVFSRIFSFVMSRGSIYSTYYGSLATIVIFMLWMYGCFYILLIGGYVNVVFSKIALSSAKNHKKP